MITITNLTHRQKLFLDIMWTMDSLDKVKGFIRTLPSPSDRADCLSLLEITVIESQEQEGGLDEYAAIAQAAIDRARS